MLKRLALAACLCLAGLPAAADSPAPAPQAAPHPEVRAARDAVKQACAGDVANFCKGIEPGQGRLMRCLRIHRGELSEGCRSAWQDLIATRRDQGH